MNTDKIEELKLENQLCFPLYAASRELMKKYRTSLDRLGLTYTQYITMAVIWEHKKMRSKDLGERLYLDSGTLTPVLKSLERKGFIRRKRCREDERVLLVELTAKGEELRDSAVGTPDEVASSVNFSKADAEALRDLLNKLLEGVKEKD